MFAQHITSYSKVLCSLCSTQDSLKLAASSNTLSSFSMIYLSIICRGIGFLLSAGSLHIAAGGDAFEQSVSFPIHCESSPYTGGNDSVLSSEVDL